MRAQSLPALPELLTVTDAAARLSCSRGHVYNLVALGQLRAVEIAIAGAKRPKTRIRAEDLTAFVEAHTRTARTA
ncbi:helix-turn-helix domain-containing protein [Nocardioides sp. AX2bis]|uniref:helix-turn-helix domain-containing protein n=1 Tax=Nocardioides sp. AX2bis TaxID=2653157 RepID=UPI0012F191E9|nr:helix-turn-helix domain-containing protein [Nocardioides sp. AX2bis]VXB34118.1 conserved hypothetical protein [Nocardioides sp. AX2bis]